MTADLDDVPARPIGAQLAVIADRAQDFGPDLLAATWRETRWSAEGAVLLVDAWRDWRGDAREFARLQQAERAAHAQGAVVPSAKWDNWRKVRERRARLSAWAVAGLVAALTIVSAAGFVWLPWHTLATCATGGLLWLGLHIRHKPLIFGCPVPVLVSLPFGVTDWRWWPVPLALLAFVVVCEQVGRRAAEPENRTRGDQARPGVSFPKLWATIEERLLADGVTAQAAGGRPIVAEGREIGVVYTVVADKALLKAHLDALELIVGAPVGGVRWFADRNRAGAGDLHVRWGDVLDEPSPVPAPQPFGSRSVGEAKRIARGQLGSPLLLKRLRKHIIVLGGTGSGKTSLGWRLLDDVAENADEKPWGIDLRRKNLIAPYIRLFEGRVAYTVADAEKLLDAFQAEIDRRVSRIAEQLEDEDCDDIPDENWIPSAEPGREQLTLFVDELTSLTPHRKLREKLSLILETGRQAACVVHELTPDLDAKKIGDSSIHDQPHVKIVMATSQYDIKEMFGVGANAGGWSVPATWERPKDAGKLLISSDEHLHPEVYRADRLEVEDIVARRRWRKATADAAAAEREAQRFTPVDETPDVIDAEIVTDEDIAREAALRAALEACGDREGLPVSEASHALDEDPLAAVRAAVTARSVYLAAAGRTVRCFPRSALVSALAGERETGHETEREAS